MPFKDFVNFSAPTDVSSLQFEYIKISLSSKSFYAGLLINSFTGSTYNLFGLYLDLFTIPIKLLRAALAILSVKGLTQEHLVKTSMSRSKYLIPWFL